MTHKRPYFDKGTTKFSHELCQILDEVAHCHPASRRFEELCPDVVCAVDSLDGPELGFSLVSKAGPDSFSLELLDVLFL